MSQDALDAGSKTLINLRDDLNLAQSIVIGFSFRHITHLPSF